MASDLNQIFNNNGSVDQKSLEFLTKALSRNNMQGFDYIEFKQSLSSLKKMNMDDETAIKSAFATASTVGLTKDKLVQTARHYQQIVDKEKAQFDEALQNQVREKIAGKKSEVERLKKQIEESNKKIKALEEDIKKSQGTIDNADADIKAAEDKINVTKNNFESTYQSILGIIAEDIDKFNKYL
jgi:peptidoglycan hydrolase CwlO-like protein